MRRLSDRDAKKLTEKSKCPFCKGREFYEGPEAGVSLNIACANES